VNKILSCMDLPTLSMNMYKRYEREIGPAIEKAAKESCKVAAEKERQLVVQNIREIAKVL